MQAKWVQKQSNLKHGTWSLYAPVKAINKTATRLSENCVCCLVCPLSVFADTSSRLCCTGSSKEPSVLASLHAKAEGVRQTGFPNPIQLCTARNRRGLHLHSPCTNNHRSVLGEIHCGYTWWLHSSPSGLSSPKLRLFNVLLLSSVPNTTIVAAKEWTEEGARLACSTETASPAAVIRGGLAGYVGPWSRQPGCLFGFHFRLPVPFHSCWIHLRHSSLGIVSQTHCLSFVLIFGTAGLFTCSAFRMA